MSQSSAQPADGTETELPQWPRKQRFLCADPKLPIPIQSNSAAGAKHTSHMPADTSKRSEMRLYDQQAERLYLNDAEFTLFLSAAERAPEHIRLFALTLAYTGIRLSEARQLRYDDFQVGSRVLSVMSLKKRRTGVVREVPVPHELIAALGHSRASSEEFIWSFENRPIPRPTAYRWIKSLMIEANISGPKTCPRGLRHAYGVRAILSGVPLHMLQRWMGHASMETTAIYATVLGPDQLILADRMWG